MFFHVLALSKLMSMLKEAFSVNSSLLTLQYEEKGYSPCTVTLMPIREKSRDLSRSHTRMWYTLEMRAH